MARGRAGGRTGHSHAGRSHAGHRGVGHGHSHGFHSRGRVGHRSGGRRYIPPPPVPIPTAIFAIEIEGAEDLCGCPGDSSVQVKPNMATTLPPQLADLYTEQEWLTLCANLKKTYADVSCPVCPWFCMCCVFWVCTKIYKGSQLATNLVALVELENRRLFDVGLQWQPAQPHWRQFNEVFTLIWLPHRPEFEHANPHRRPVSREYPPRKYCTNEQLAAQGLPVPVDPMQMMQTMMIQLAASNAAGVVHPMQPGMVVGQPIYVQPAQVQPHVASGVVYQSPSGPQQQSMEFYAPRSQPSQPVAEYPYHAPPPSYHPPPHTSGPVVASSGHGAAYYQPASLQSDGPTVAPSPEGTYGITYPPASEGTYGITHPPAPQYHTASPSTDQQHHGFCGHCGAQLAGPNERFCAQCGVAH